jgi:hypothetical protein
MIAIRHDGDQFQVRMAGIVGKARRPVAVLAVAGREGANLLRRHFLEKDETDVNKLAPDRREHLWQEIAHGVQAPVVDEAGNRVSISINHPVIAQKVFGGPITAKRGIDLSIPETEEAYGRMPSVFERETGLKLIFIKQGDHALLAARVDPDSKVLQVEYLLTPRVDQKADDTALPEEREWEDAILGRAQETLNLEIKEGQ